MRTLFFILLTFFLQESVRAGGNIGPLFMPLPEEAPSGSTGNGYFVLTSGGYNGNLGGLGGAAAKCLTDLTNNVWIGKSDAQTRGLLTSANVRPFLCDGSACAPLVPSTSYSFALSGDASKGGATFTTDSMGRGPGNAVNWSGAAAFGTSVSYWSGRGMGSTTKWGQTSLESSGSDVACSAWSVGTFFGFGTTGASNGTSWGRWYGLMPTGCNSSNRLVCLVSPAKLLPDAWSITNLTNQAGGTLIPSAIIPITGIEAAVPVAVRSDSEGAQYRVCADASCATVVTDWGRDVSLIPLAHYLQARLVTSGDPSTAVTMILSVGESRTTWSATTMAGIDNTPTAGTPSFTALTGQAVNTTVTSNISQVTGIVTADLSVGTGDALSAEFRICADAACSSVITNWTAARTPISNNQYVQLRLTTAPAAGTSTTFKLKVGTATVDWNATTVLVGSGGYFVLSGGTGDGNFGGLSGANARCLSDLTAYNWAGKADAMNRGLLVAAKVRAFLCDASNCQNATPNTVYRFASGGLVKGGGSFTSDASGLGPNNADMWNLETHFAAGMTYHTGRSAGAANVWGSTTSGSHCVGWTSNGGADLATAGMAGSFGTTRWNAVSGSCMTAAAFICFVHP